MDAIRACWPLPLLFARTGAEDFSFDPYHRPTELDPRLLTWFQTVRQARTASDKLFSSFQALLEEFQQQENNGYGRGGDSSHRFHGARGNDQRLDQPLR